MKIFSRDFLSELNSKASLGDFIGMYLGYPEVDTAFFYTCPYCGHRKLSLDRNHTNYYCWECQSSGDTIGFLMNVDELAFDEAVEVLADMYELEIKTLSDSLNRLEEFCIPDDFVEILFKSLEKYIPKSKDADVSKERKKKAKSKKLKR